MPVLGNNSPAAETLATNTGPWLSDCAGRSLASRRSLIVYACACRFLYANSEVKDLTTWQYTMIVFYGLVLAVWAGAEAGFLAAKLQPRYDAIAEDEQDLVGEDQISLKGSEGEKSPGSALAPDTTVVCIKASQLKPLRLLGEFALIMGFLYLCDRTTIVAKGPKYVSPTAFWSVCAAILALGLFTMRGGEKKDSEPVDFYVKPLQRDQTEEWKGWMQIMFVLYHYFAEAEIYNAIRMCVRLHAAARTATRTRTRYNTLHTHAWGQVERCTCHISYCPRAADRPRALLSSAQVHCGVRLDDGLRQLFVLLRQERFHRGALHPDDVASQLLRHLRLPDDEQRVHALLHLPDAHLLHVGGLHSPLHLPLPQRLVHRALHQDRTQSPHISP